MESKYSVNADKYIEENNIKDTIAAYVKNETEAADTSFKYFIFNLMQ